MIHISRNYYTPILGFLFIVSILLLQIQPLESTSESPYDSGYDHGCDDADFRYPGDRYINQPGNGPSQHTKEFMNGYEEGFNACNDKGYEVSTGFPELDEGESYGRCEMNSDGNLVCDIEND